MQNNLKFDNYPLLQGELSKTQEKDHLGGTNNDSLGFLNTEYSTLNTKTPKVFS
ncbi:MAG: hypothetical protein U9Q33_08225 [Campylobacterota bacterium]|nr:hypothetical protein [Campylobacterota bacterium]